MNELEELSREAAKVLPDEIHELIGGYEDGSRYFVSRRVWLAESTEACAEIMVRELKGLWTRVYAVMLHLIEDDGVDEMQAFRTAVLRTLIEVKK